MGIGIPNEMCQRNSDKGPLDLLREARETVDKLADKYGMLASNQSVQEIYALIDGAIFKLENIKEPIRKIVDEGPKPSSTGYDPSTDDRPLDGIGIAKAVWEMFTKE